MNLKKLRKEMEHPKSERVLLIQAGLKMGGCPAEKLQEATLESLKIHSKVKPEIHHIVNKPKTTSKFHPWKDSRLQFARLIAELQMAGAFTRKNLMADLRDSMDLTDAEILELVERATNFWEGAKFAMCPPGRTS